MNKYCIEHEIRSLLEIADDDFKGVDPPQFKVDDFIFKQRGYSLQYAYTENTWIVSRTILADNSHEAINRFRTELKPIICALSLVGQAYIEYNTFSFFVKKQGSDLVFFHFEDFDLEPETGLHLSHEQVEAVKKILSHKKYSNFLSYWREMTNSLTYTAKISIFCSAVDALAKVYYKGEKNFGISKEKHELREFVLGKDLSRKLFGTKKKSEVGIRNSFSHGDFFESDPTLKIEGLHNIIINFFNEHVIQEYVIEEVTGPQRHFLAGRSLCNYWLKLQVQDGFDLGTFLDAFGGEDSKGESDKWTLLFGDERPKTLKDY